MAGVVAASRPTGLRSSITNGILVETMQLVDPSKQNHVPNHLLDSKIYAKVAQNSVVKATPAAIHFGGFETGKLLQQSLRIGNVDTEVIRMHIIPPQSKYFNIKYKKQERLVPGMTLDCTVEFFPDEWRYYYDCIRIHCKGEDNLIIPIHAYPILDASSFPQIITFPPVPIGHRKSRIIPLRSDVPIDFEFQISHLQPHSAFTVEPMAGIIPANGEIEVEITFAPVEFHTARMICQLNVSQFNFKPITCTCTGTSTAGLAKELVAKQILKEAKVTEERPKPESFTVMSPLDRAREKKKITRKDKKDNGFTESFVQKKEIQIEGIHFPTNLDTPYAVTQVLNQTPGKLRVKDYREAMAKKDMQTSSRQMKEAIFDHAVKQDVYEERQNQLRWQVRLGDNQMTPEQRQAVVEKRQDAWNTYKYIKRGEPVVDKELQRVCTTCTFRRTSRDSIQLAEEKIQFDTYTNNPWAARHDALSKFAQAARMVIVRLRADKKIKGLHQMILDWKKKKHAPSATSGDEQEKQQESEEHDKPVAMTMTSQKIKSVRFPLYVPPNVKDDMAPDALDNVPVPPLEIVIKKKVNFHELKVPHLSKVMSYKPHNIHESAQGYVPSKLMRQLRVGAEDEIISLPNPVQKNDNGSDSPPINEGDMFVTDMTDDKVPVPSGHQPALKAPAAMLRPMEYPPLHIFNPAPGLQVFQAPLPYAEVDPDFHLNPLPRYAQKNPELGSTQKTFLDREDVIKGVMTWKKFPSQGLTSLANTPTLTNVWVPRWSDPFSEDMLPHDVPTLLDALSEDDRENIYDESMDSDLAENFTKSEPISLTPEMVNAQFSMVTSQTNIEEKHSSDMFPYGNKMPSTNIPVSTTGPVPREKREQEIDYFLNKKYNKLGQKIQSRVDQMNKLITKPDLVLK